MVILIIGSPDSGKSRLAEDKACQLAGNNGKYYLATMIAYDDAGLKRIEKHKALREGKGFITIEIPYGVDRAISMMDKPEEKTILLECISNLVGNEIHENKENADLPINTIAKRVISQIGILSNQVKHMVIVTNEFAIKPDYDKDTVKYIETISVVNNMLREYADNVELINNEGL